MTVSRVINDGPNVRDATRQRVIEAIRVLDYAPNQAARSLASAQSLKIGLLYNNPSAAYLSEVLLGGLDQSSKAGAQLVVEKCEPDAEAEALDRLLSSGVDGVLLPAPCVIQPPSCNGWTKPVFRAWPSLPASRTTACRPSASTTPPPPAP